MPASEPWPMNDIIANVMAVALSSSISNAGTTSMLCVVKDDCATLLELMISRAFRMAGIPVATGPKPASYVAVGMNCTSNARKLLLFASMEKSAISFSMSSISSGELRDGLMNKRNEVNVGRKGG